MNPNYRQIITAPPEDRRSLFQARALALGTSDQYVEKDFWVCWTLDALFNGINTDGHRLLFKGGTSLAKAHRLISRFSEDIDITVFRQDLGFDIEASDLEQLSGKQRRKTLDRIRDECAKFVQTTLKTELEQVAGQAIGPGNFTVELDADDPDGQSLTFTYPSCVTAHNGYIRSAVKIEAGARSALDPHAGCSVSPFVADEMAFDLEVHNVVTVNAERTFWDKVIIAHGQRQWFDRRGEVKLGAQRVTRHYYDLFCLQQAPEFPEWADNRQLAVDCAVHANAFFGRADQGLALARRGTFTLVPAAGMEQALRNDYDAMAGMIFGPVPAFDDILASIAKLEAILNGQ